MAALRRVSPWTWSGRLRISKRRMRACDRPRPRSRPRNRMNASFSQEPRLPAEGARAKPTTFDHEKLSMLCGLVDRFDESGQRFHEEEVQYRIRPALPPESRTRTRTRTRKKKPG